MPKPSAWRQYPETLAECAQHPFSAGVFSRALTAFVLMKLLWQWPIHQEVLSGHQLRLAHGVVSGPLMFPAGFANGQPLIFTLIAAGFLGIHLLARLNHLTAWLFCWLSFNLLVINRPAGDGGDTVAFMLSLWTLFLVPPEKGVGGVRQVFQTIIYNLARLGCMLQFVFLYAASGVDKLNSNVWATGQAFSRMREAGGIISPDFPTALTSPFGDFLFTWSTIALEIGFGLLVWFRNWQPAMILMAIVFHLGIWWMLSLPDFALVMIVAVLIFIRDDQYHRIFRPWLLST
jgi:hypothetical protein